MNVFYASIRTTENYEFDKIRTAEVTGNAINYKNSQGDNPICSTRDEISQPSRPFSPRVATACRDCWGERSCPRSVTAIHSVAVVRTWNLRLRKTLPLNYRRPNTFPRFTIYSNKLAKSLHLVKAFHKSFIHTHSSPGVSKHFLRRATLNILLLLRATCLYYKCYVYNRFETLKSFTWATTKWR